MDGQPITEDEIKALVRDGIDSSTGYLDSQLTQDRERLLNAYYGRPYGDEVEGLSKVVSRDTMDTVEWTLAQLLRIFTSDRFCEFTPHGPEDVEAAEQQSDYVQHVLMEENGFMLFHDLFKDALLLRSGIAHWGREEDISFGYESYTGLTPQQLEMALMDEGAQLIARTDRPEALPDGSQVMLSDVRVKRLKRKAKCSVVAIPPEEFMIERGARCIEEAGFVGHKKRATKSDLIKAGYPRDKIEQISFDVGDSDDTADQRARDVNRDGDILNDEQGTKSRCWLYIVYIRVDFDGDDMDELVCVHYAGNELLKMEPVEDVPYASLCPVRMPHRFEGLSYADLVEDIQRIKTVLWRQSLDNLYLSNQPMKEVVEGKVNYADLQQARIGGNIRVKEAGSIREIIVTPMTESALRMVDYVDQVATKRTGISANGQGIDSESLNNGTSGVAYSQAISQMMARVEMVARIFAEGGIKQMFRGVYSMIARNPDVVRTVKLRNNWVNIDPRGWKERNDVTVTVGLGVGSRAAQLATLKDIGNLQSAALQAGLPVVTPANLYHSMQKYVEAAGYKDIDNWLTNPSKLPPPPPPVEDPAIVIAKMQAQLETQKMQAAADAKQMDFKIKQAELQLEAATLRNNAEMQQVEAELKRMAAESVERAEMMKAQERAEQAQQDARLKAEALEQANRHFYDELTQKTIIEREKVQVSIVQASNDAAADAAAIAKLTEIEKEAA